MDVAAETTRTTTEAREAHEVAVTAAMPLPGFAEISYAQLDAASPEWLDRLDFGVIGLAATGEVEIYNAPESRHAGLRPATVLGRHFFLAVGVCMNNYLVAQRFDDEPELDATISYVLTFRMRPTPVQLRMMRRPGPGRRFILIHR